MKVLYISHAKEHSGWGSAARGYIKALMSTGVDLVCRTVDFNPQYKEQWLENLTSKSIDGVTHCIQHVLPNLMEYDGRFKNIGLYVSETANLDYTGWNNKLKLMDEIWTSSYEQYLNSQNLCHRIVPHAFDISIYDREYPKFNLDLGDRYVFYFVGEHTRRKNISALLRVYYSSFTANDNVALVIKTHRSGSRSEEVVQSIFEIDNSIKEGLKLYNSIAYYPPIAVIGEYLSQDELYGLHQRCDCFTTASFGEGWDIEAFDAYGFGNQIIASNMDAHFDYVRGLQYNLYESTQEFVFGADTFVKGLHTGHEIWNRPNEVQMSKRMKEVYKLRSKKLKPKNLDEFSYETVGKIMLEYLV